MVGEKTARDGLSPELDGRVWPELLVDIGVKPRREPCLLFHAEVCGLVLLEPAAVGFDAGREGSFAEEEGGWLIDAAARTLRRWWSWCIAAVR